jgi:NAD(P)-dependent dehydrogenase (short-subunit alcohol dehydrogenase family)
MNLAEITAMYDFTGKTFLVTGGTGVLGGVVAGALVDAGANVVVLDRSLDPAKGLVDYTHKSGWQGKAVRGDVLNRASLVDAAAAIKAEYGPIYGLVNAAGGNSPKATVSPTLSFFDIPEEGMRFVLDLNLLGTMIPCQIFAEHMAETGEGVILNYSSMNASGFFLGEQNRYLLTDKDTGAWTPRGQKILDHTPMGRLGVPEDLVGTSLWLLSPAAAFVTGIVVPVDGGFSACAGV